MSLKSTNLSGNKGNGKSAHPNTGEAERNKTILRHMPIVRYIAGRIAARLPGHIEVDDLISAGVLGLIDALDKFDSSRGIKFRTYAEFRIRGAIIDELRNLDFVTRSIRQIAARLERAFAEVEQQKLSRATWVDVAEKLQLDPEQVEEMMSRSIGMAMISVDELRDMEDDGEPRRNLLDFLIDPRQEPPVVLVIREQLKKIVEEAILTLKRDHQLVLIMYYYRELPMRQIGDIMGGLTESRVSQIHSSAVLALRSRISVLYTDLVVRIPEADFVKWLQNNLEKDSGVFDGADLEIEIPTDEIFETFSS